MSNPGKLFLIGLLAMQAAAAFGQTAQTDQAAQQDGAASVTTSLEGSNWQLVQLTALGGFVFTPDDPGKYVLNFRSENRLTGKSDCNQITGTWLQEDSTLRFQPFSSSRSLCSPGSLHNNFVLYLRDVQVYELQSGKMLLRTNTDGVRLEFESRD